MNNPLLSICIPTYNRAEHLKETILSIVNQKRFVETNDVEIVISDNNSNDETPKIISDFVKIYGEKIRYYKNQSTTLAEINFEMVLSYGKGIYLKLNNDTLKHIDGSLDKMIEVINENKTSRNILYFLNGVSKTGGKICYGFDSFIKNVSFYVTWIAIFGIWREDLTKVKDFSRYANLQLSQTDVMFRIMDYKENVFINNDILFISIHPNTKGGYDLLTVFLDNYFFLLTEQLNKGKLTNETFIKEKRKLLFHFIRPMLAYIKIYPKRYYFECKKKYERIFNHYKNDLVIFFIFIITYYISIPYIYFKIWEIKKFITNKFKKI